MASNVKIALAKPEDVRTLQERFEAAQPPSVDFSQVYTAQGVDVSDLIQKLKKMLEEIYAAGPGDPVARGHFAFDFVTGKIHWFVGPVGLNKGVDIWALVK